ncbi:MAG: GAF domain-containing protein [Sphaerobacter thermophilus]|uniref:GAF domain-containing protein n=1 Tax=Sphaerobacter thermophilus TaxID=2057 RepID=UPI002355D327
MLERPVAGNEQPARDARDEPLRFLAEAGIALARTLDYRETLAAVARLAVPALGDCCAVYLLDDQGFLQRVAIAHADPQKQALAVRMTERFGGRPDAPHGPAYVLRTLRTAFYPTITEAMHRAVLQDPEHLDIVLRLGFRSSIVVPLIARDRTLGVISFILTEPGREYGPSDIALAEELAQRVAIAVDNALLHRELARAVEQQAASLALFDTLFASAPVGLALLDRDLRYVRVNDAIAAMNGLPPEAHLGKTVRDLFPHLAPEIEPRIRHVLETGELLANTELTGTLSAGEKDPRTWLVSYFPVPGPDGQVSVVGVAAAEITETKRAEQERERLLAQLEAERARLETVLQQMPAGVILADAPSGQLILANAEAERIWRLPFQSGGSVQEWETIGYRALHPDGTRYRPEEWPLARALKDGTTVSGEEIDIIRGDGSRGSIRVDAAPVRDRDGRIVAGVVSFVDITERRRAEERERYLAEVRDVLTSSLDAATTLQRIAELTVPRLADWCAILLVDDDGHVERQVIAHQDPEKVRWALEIERRHPFAPDAPHGIARVIQTGQPEFYPEITDTLLEAVSRNPEHLRALQEAGFCSMIVAPLQARGRIVGAIMLAMAESGRRYLPDDLTLAREVARRIGLAVDHARLYAAEQQARRAAEQTATRIAQLQALTAALGAALTPREIAAVTISQEFAVLGIRRGIIVQVTDDDDVLEVLAAVGCPEEWGEYGRRFPREVLAPLADVTRTGTPIFLESREAIADRYPACIADPHCAEDAALAVLPLTVDGRVLGAMALAFTTPQPFDEEDRAFLLALARQSAHALDRARLYQAEQDARAAEEAAHRRQIFLAQASSVLNSSLDYQQTMRTIAEMAVPDFADWCIVRIFDKRDGLRHVAIAHTDPERRDQLHEAYTRRPPHHVHPHPIAEALGSDKAVLRPALEEADWVTIASNEEHLSIIRLVAPRSIIVAPLIARGHRLGLISFICSDSRRHYGPDDLALAEDLAQRAAIAVDNALLFRATQEAEEKSRRQAARMTALAAASRAFAEASLDLNAVLETVAERVAELVSDGCLIRLIPGDKESEPSLRPGAIYHPDPEARALARDLFTSNDRSALEDLHRDALQSGQPVILEVADPESLRHTIHPEYLAYLDRFPLRRLLAVPLSVRGNTLGTLVVWRDLTDQPFTSDDSTLIQDLADRAALAIENAQLYREAQSAVRVREAFLSTASHELKTPLTTVKGYGQLLLRFLKQPTLDREHLIKLATHLRDQTDRFETLVNDLLDVSRIQQGRLALRPQPTELTELARSVLARFEQSPDRTPAHRLVLDAPEPIHGVWDPVRLDQVLTNLISNALKYSPDGGEVRLSVRRHGDEAELAVSDEGIGISASEQAQLFQPFSRTVRARLEMGGTGLGLFISRQIVEQHGGTITLESTEGVGSTFTVRLPLTPPDLQSHRENDA